MPGRRPLCLLLLSMLVLNACATTRGNNDLWLPPGEAVQTAQLSFRGIETEVDSRGETQARGAAISTAGAVGGGALGVTYGAVLGLGCGPAFWICSPLAAAGLGILGAAGGATAGSDEFARGVNANAAETFNTLSERHFANAQVQSLITERFNLVMNDNWVTGMPDSGNTIRLDIRQLQVAQEDGELIRLEAVARLTLRANGRTESSNITVRTTDRPVGHWIANDGAHMSAALEELANLLVNATAVRIAGEHWRWDLALLETEPKDE